MDSNQHGLLKVYKRPLTNRGPMAWLLSALLFAFYIDIYRYEHLTVVAHALGLDSKWRLYGLLYTVAVVVGGIFFLKKHGNNRYHRYRTYTIMGVQIVFAFSLPAIMKFFTGHEHYFSYFWPLKIEYFYPSYIAHQPLPIILYSFLGSLVVVPLLGFYFGKRFYCSWICGCGGLANTAGDPFRHLSSKSETAWKIERITIYTMFFVAVVTTVIVVVNWMVKDGSYPLFSYFAFKVQDLYGFWVGFMWSGALGVALYPIAGTRFWCRFGCPMAALLGMIQKFGRFRITVKDDMCIACGNCSAHCEMGIDVRLYAMRNESFRRASCVGCGMCAHVCPRGVLRLETK